MQIISNWRPSLRNIAYNERPEWVPKEVYAEAVAAKRHYNAGWEFWVHLVSIDYNVSMADAEVACIRGIKKEILRMYTVWGEPIGKWYEEFLDMGDLFRRISYPDYIPQLGEINGLEKQHPSDIK